MRVFLVSLSLLAFYFSPSSALPSLTTQVAVKEQKWWCATQYSVTWGSRSTCEYEGGKLYKYKSQAKAEQKRLAADSSTAPSSSSTASSSGSGFVWCATVEDVNFVRLSACLSKGGQSFSLDRSRAKAEHKRLKAASSTAASSKKVWCLRHYHIDTMSVDRMSELSCAYIGGTAYSSRSKANSELNRLTTISNRMPVHDPGWRSNNSYWCATKNKVWETTGWACWKNNKGEYFLTRAEAEAEFFRLRSDKDQIAQRRDTTAYCFDEDSDKYYFGPHRDPWNAGCSPGDLRVSLHEYIQETSVPAAVSHLVWCGEIKPSVGIRWVWRNTRTSCIESGGTVIAADDESKAHAEEAYDPMLAELDDPYVKCGYGGEIVTEKRSVCEANDGFHTSGNLTWCGKSFKKRCSEKTESVALQPQTGWCASPWQVRYTSRQHCGRTDEELWPTRSSARTAHTRLRKEHYEGSNVVVWCATAQSFEKTRITDCESIDGTTWSTQALARAEHDRLKSVLSVAQVQVPKKVWCATASDVWETDKGSCHHKGGRDFTNQHLAENESIRRLEAKNERERKQREREAIAEKKRQELAAITKREQNLKKLLATKSCRECDLRGVDLRKADLNGAILVKANLQGASLVMASLEGSNLTGANLREVDLTGANLAKATLRKADLSQAHVTPRFLNLFPTNLSWADLSEAKLVGANLAGVNFTGAVLTQADLTRANLMNVDLDDADLSGAILIETSLIEANLDHADLTDANLSRANLTDACLDRTNLSRANLSNTFLSKATFRKANLNQVNLQKSRLSNADLSGVDLRGADLSEANLTRANLRGTGLEGAQLHGANLYEADLTGADLSRADLEGVNLIRARLRIADLRWSNLSEAELDGAKLVGANLTGANLTRASLNRSDLSRANLTKADLSGADLNRADLSRTALIHAILVGTDLYRATLDKADLSQADLTNADLTGVSSQEVIWDQVVLCGTMMQSRVIDDSGCKPDRKNTEPINHRS